MYTDLLRRVYLAIKAVDPDAQVVGGGLVGYHPDFINGMMDAGAGDWMDYFSYHPYVYSAGFQQGPVYLLRGRWL